MGEGRGVHRVLVGNSEGKRPLGRPRPLHKTNNILALKYEKPLKVFRCILNTVQTLWKLKIYSMVEGESHSMQHKSRQSLTALTVI
jgi:hypothetical protein